jgi:hypothetical protein
MLEQVGKVSDAQPTTICKIEEDDRLIAPFGSADMFWRWMVVNHHARLAGGDASSGRSSPGVYPPPSLKDMQNDAYRSLASFMEDPCGIDMSGDYAQFAWADFLRAQHIPAPTTLDGHKEQGRKAGEAVLSMAKSDPNIRAAMHPLPGGDAFLAESCKEKPKQPK